MDDLLKRHCSRVQEGNQGDQDGAEWRAHGHNATGSLCRDCGAEAARQLLVLNHSSQECAESRWWWLDAHASDRTIADPENEAKLKLERDSAAGDNQSEEEKLAVRIDKGTVSPSAASEAHDLAFLSESSSECEVSSHRHRQHSTHDGSNETKSCPQVGSWFSNQDPESSSDDGSTGDVSSISSRSLVSSDRSSLSHESAGFLAENEEQSQPFSGTRIRRVESSASVSWLTEDGEMSLALGEAIVLQAAHREFAFGVDMLTLWHGFGSASSSSKSASGSEDSSSSSGEDSAFGDAEVSSQPSSSISRSASVEDLDSFSSIDGVSSLSSFSVQSGVCKNSSPRLIENIPVAPAVTNDADEWSHTVDTSSPANPRYWLHQDFVKPEGPAVAIQREHIERRRLVKLDHSDARLKWSKRPPFSQEHTEINTHQSHFVREDAELFVKSSELEGILVDHVPRRHGFFLDVGCGTSSICREMVLHGYNRVYGIDIAPQKIQFQQDQCKELQEFVRFQEMDASEMKFPDKLFDCIFTKALLDIVASSYVYEPSIDDSYDELQRILREIWRCLQPGGVWIIVSCHGSRSTAATEDAHSNDRHYTPWWKWKGIAEFIHRHYDRVKTYGAGIPLVQHGKRVKPFVVMVYKRKETSRQQRLTRLYQSQFEEQRGEHEFVVATQWLAEKRRLQAEEASSLRETRQMIVEGAISRLQMSDLAYATAIKAREVTRAEIYKAMIEADRVLMTTEGTLAAAVRVEANAMLVFITNALVSISDAAVEVAMSKMKELPSQEVVAGGNAQQSIAEENPTPAATVATAKFPQEEISSEMTRNSAADDTERQSSGFDAADSTQLEQPDPAKRDEQIVIGNGQLQMAEVPSISPIQKSPFTNPGSESSSGRGSLAHEPEIPADASDSHTVIENGDHVLKIEGEEQVVGVTGQHAEDLNEREMPIDPSGSSEADATTSKGDQRQTSATGLAPPAIVEESSSDKKPKVVPPISSIVEVKDRSTVTAKPANDPSPDTAADSSKLNSSSGGELRIGSDNANYPQRRLDPLLTGVEDENARAAAEDVLLYGATAAQECTLTAAEISEQSCNGASNCTPNHQSAQTLVTSSANAPATSHDMLLLIENATSSPQVAVLGASDRPRAPNTGSVSGNTEPVVEALSIAVIPTELALDEQSESKQDTSSGSVACDEQLLPPADGDESVPPAFLLNEDDEVEGRTVQGCDTAASDPDPHHHDGDHATKPSESPEQDPTNECIATSPANVVRGRELQSIGNEDQSDHIINGICSEMLARIVKQIRRDGEGKVDG